MIFINIKKLSRIELADLEEFFMGISSLRADGPRARTALTKKIQKLSSQFTMLILQTFPMLCISCKDHLLLPREQTTIERASPLGRRRELDDLISLEAA